MNFTFSQEIEPAQDLPAGRLGIIAEIAAVFLPMMLGLFLSARTGSDSIPLGGDLRILGGPAAYLGLGVSLGLLWFFSRRRGVSWGEFGLRRPKNWLWTVLHSLGIALAVFLAVKVVINPLLAALPVQGEQDLSRYDYLAGDLPNLLIILVVIWVTAAFLEEFLFRGYLMNRLIALQGRHTRLAWGLAVVGQAMIFGVVHAVQSPVGMLKVGLIGLVFGLAYLVTGRNLWPLILAHGLIDSLDMFSHYSGF